MENEYHPFRFFADSPLDSPIRYGTFGFFEEDPEAEVLDAEGLVVVQNSPFDTSQYDVQDDETEDDLTAPHPVKAVYVLFLLLPHRSTIYVMA